MVKMHFTLFKIQIGESILTLQIPTDPITLKVTTIEISVFVDSIYDPKNYT